MFEPQSGPIQATNRPYKENIPMTPITTEQIMTIRAPFTILTLAALLMASGPALGGGMPSDEGPEVILNESGLGELGYYDGDILDEDTITAIIKSQIPPYSTDDYLPAEYVAAVTVAEAVEPTPLSATELPSALFSPEYEWLDVDR